ncbi:MAG: hypothetical protein ACTSSH_04465 [Candidatus Heimdallarchaeota archaeon]
MNKNNLSITNRSSKKLIGLMFIALFIGGSYFLHLVSSSSGSTTSGDFISVEREGTILGSPLDFAPEEITTVANLSKCRNYLYQDGSIVYALKYNLIEVYNVSQSDNPVLIETYQAAANVTFEKILVTNGLLFTSYIEGDPYWSDYNSHMAVIDCSNPQELTLVTTYEFVWEANFAVSDGYLLVNALGIMAYNITNVLLPELVWTIPMNETGLVWDFALTTDTIFTYGGSGFTAYDLTNISAPQFLGNASFAEEVNHFKEVDFNIVNNIYGYINDADYANIFVYNLADPTAMMNLTNINLQLTSPTMHYTSSHLYVVNRDGLKIYQFTSPVSLALIGSYNDPIERRYSRFFMFSYYRFMGITLKGSTACLWRQTFYEVKYQLYIIDLTDLTSPTLLWKTEVTDYSLLATKLLTAFVLILPIFLVVFLAGLFVRSVVRKRLKRKNKENTLPQLGDKVETDGTPEEFSTNRLLNFEFLKSPKILMVGYFVFFIQNIVMLLVTAITIGASGLYERKFLGYLLGVPLLLDLLAGAILFVGFAWYAYEKKSKKAMLAAISWLAWIGMAIFYRLNWGMPGYQGVIWTSFVGENTDWLYQSYLYYTYFFLTVVVFWFANFTTVLANKQKPYLIALSLVYSSLNWFLSLIYVVYIFPVIDCDIVEGGLYGTDWSLGYWLLSSFALLLKVTIVPILGIVVFYLMYRELRKQYQTPAKLKMFAGVAAK